MADVYVLSSYDEYIYYLEHTAGLLSAVVAEHALVVLNCEPLGRFLQSPISTQFIKKMFIVPPFLRFDGLFHRFNLLAERCYFREAWKRLSRSEDFDGFINLYVYTNFMNAPTASLINHLV